MGSFPSNHEGCQDAYESRFDRECAAAGSFSQPQSDPFRRCRWVSFPIRDRLLNVRATNGRLGGTLTNCVVSGNTAVSGGGVYN